MPKLKDKIKHILISKKPVLALLLFFVILGIITPIHQANAYGILVGLGIGLLTTILHFIGEAAQAVLIIVASSVAISYIADFFLSVSMGLLKLVTSPGFITLSYTNPANNDILKYGWTATRDLVNIGFVIVLIIIGLATALRIREYQWQKTLPRLIAIILLVNFTPVIIGAVVDASNIVMNHFLIAREWGSFSAIIERGNVFTNIFHVTKKLFEPSEFVKVIIYWVYAFTTGAILIVYSILFIMRYVAIWILVILSPLAFFAYILPHTRQYFRMWWRQLLNWCFIGAVAAFFLYLSNKILTGSIIKTGGTLTGVQQADLITTLLPYFVIVFFLYIGFFFGLKTSAFGAGAVVSWAQKKGRAGIGVVKRWAGTKARIAPQKLVGEARWKKIADRLATLRGPLGIARPFGRAMKRLPETEIKIADEAEAKAKKMDAARIATEIKRGLVPRLRRSGEIAGLLSGAAEDSDKVKDVVEKFKVSNKEIENAIKWYIGQGKIDKAKKIYGGFGAPLQKEGIRPEDLGLKFDLTTEKGREQGKEFGVKKEEALPMLRAAFPRKTEEELEKLADFYDKKYKDYEGYAGKIVADARTAEEIKGLKDLLTSKKPEHAWVQNVVHKFWDSTQARRSGEEIGSAFIERFQEAAHDEDWYRKENPKMGRFLESTAAQSAGFAFSTAEAAKIRDLEDKEFKTRIHDMKARLRFKIPDKEREELTKRLKMYEKELARRERREWEAAEAAAEEKPEEGKKEKGPRRKRGTTLK